GGGNPYNSGAAGFWYVINKNLKVGGSLGVALDSQPVYEIKTDDQGDFDEFKKVDNISTTKFDILLAPTVHYYVSPDGPVTPYFFGQLNFRKMFDGNDKTTGSIKKSIDKDDKFFNPNEQLQMGIAGGFGIEWFPVKNFSINGHVGLGVDILRQASVSSGLKGDESKYVDQDDPPSGPFKRGKGLAIGTFTSSLSANFYF
ncbi:MAG: hypothetical protein ABEL76_00370, partial [Bradymonadaceae bacterium]